MNPYHHLAAEYARLLREGKSYPLGDFPPLPRLERSPEAPKALFFAPHPDDECIVGALAVRLLREARMNVFNVAVTQGSKKERQQARFQELEAACNYLGFGLLPTGPHGLEKINSRTRESDPAHWAAAIGVIRKILEDHRPKVILFPHLHDWNSTHIGTHLLVLDALGQMPPAFECYLVETEFWGQLTEPNLMVEVSTTDLGDMMTATSFHVGEVKRNPYHLLLPGWMMDNVRRGSELVGGQGGGAPDFTYAALYRLRRWEQSRVVNVFDGGKQVSRAQNVKDLFP